MISTYKIVALALFSLMLSVSTTGQCLPPQNVTQNGIQLSWSGPIDTFYVEFGPKGYSQATGSQTIIDTTIAITLMPCDSIDVSIARKCGNDTSLWVGPFTVYFKPATSTQRYLYLHDRICGDSIYSYTQKGFEFGNKTVNSPSWGADTMSGLVSNWYSKSNARYMYADGSGTPDSSLSYFTPWYNTAFNEALHFFYFSNNIASPGDNVTLRVHIDNGINVFNNAFVYSGDAENWQRKVIFLQPYFNSTTNKIRAIFQIDQTTSSAPEYNDFLLDEILFADTSYCNYTSNLVGNNVIRNGTNLTLIRTHKRPKLRAQWGPFGFTPNNGQWGDTTVFNTDTLVLNNLPQGAEWMYLKDTCTSFANMHSFAPWIGPLNIDTTSINVLFGNVYLDMDNNCTYDSNSYPMRFLRIKNYTTGVMSYSNNNGLFRSTAAMGANLLAIAPSNNTQASKTTAANCSADTVYFNTSSINNAIKDFVRKPTTYQDIQMVSYAGVHMLQGDTAELSIASVYNHGAAVYSALDVFVTIDTSLFEIIALNGYTPVQPNTNKFFKTILDLKPFEARRVSTPIIMGKIGSQFLGQTSFSFYVDSVPGDAIPSNNWSSTAIYNVAAIDPNDKTVWPAGNTADTAIRQLTYRIRFQNEGNYPAQTVRVVDTLPAYLNPENFMLLNTSHECYTNIDANGVIEFMFYNIQLPDSASDPEGSKGHIDFSIDLDQPMVLGDSVANRAHIFFDYQPAVITNWAWTQIVEPEDFNVDEFEQLDFMIYPNPAKNKLSIQVHESGRYAITISDLSGRVLGNYWLEGTKTMLDISHLHNGMYHISFHSLINKAAGVQLISVLK